MIKINYEINYNLIINTNDNINISIDIIITISDIITHVDSNIGHATAAVCQWVALLFTCIL